MDNLFTQYKKEIAPMLSKKLEVKNIMATPKLVKIVINMGVKDALTDKKSIEKHKAVLAQIAGQAPTVTKAKKSISSFKLREGDEIGLCVTLRGKRMFDFYEKLVRIVMPRLRDFHGVSPKSFDGQGNYSLGFFEYSVFVEIDQAKVDRIQGLSVQIVTNAKNNKEGYALLEALGMPFAKGK